MKRAIEAMRVGFMGFLRRHEVSGGDGVAARVRSKKRAAMLAALGDIQRWPRQRRTWTSQPDSAAVAVGVARKRALDVVPTVAHGALGLVPGQAGIALGGFPVALQVRLDLVELAATVVAIRVVAELVGRLVVVPLAARGVV